jgi:hypothetical protein
MARMSTPVIPLVEALWTDAWQALRQMQKKPVFAGLVVLVLAAGFAVSTAMFWQRAHWAGGVRPVCHRLCPMDRPADGRFGEVANEENAAAVKLRQADETIEKRARFRSAIEVNFQTQETVPGIEDHEVGLGFLERVLKIAESGVRRGHGTRRDGSTQDDQARGIPVEAGEAGLNDLRGSVFRRGIKDGGWFELFAGERVAAACQCRRDGEGDPSLS